MNIRDKLRKNRKVLFTYTVAMEHLYRIRYSICKKNNSLYTALMKKDYKRSVKAEMRVPPISYTEKIEYRKFYGITPEMSLLSDKYRVRDWVAKKIGEEYLIPLLGVWDSFDAIDFEKLPSAFVLKTNNACGTNYIVKNKSNFDSNDARKFFDFWMKRDFAFAGKGYETQYSTIPPKIIAEKYMEAEDGELRDYKFLCFDSCPYYCWVDIGRYHDHRRNIYDLEWNLQNWSQCQYKSSDSPIDVPLNYDEMINVTKKLCEGFSHVRVDLYNVDGKIYFGEMTFTNGKGHELIYPAEQNDYLGSLWK